MPENGSSQGTQNSSVAHVAWVSCAACAATAGKHADRHRPSAPVPANGSHAAGTDWPPEAMMPSGVQKPPSHAASCACCAAGTSAVGKQCAPPHAGEHAGNDAGSTTSAPFHGQVNITGGCFGESHATEHTPVGAEGSAAIGSKQGAQTSPSAHVAFGNTSASAATAGRQVEMQRPSAPATDVHVAGTPLPPLAMKLSGVQKPPSHAASCACCATGMSDEGTQRAPPHTGLQSGNTIGSIMGGPV